MLILVFGGLSARPVRADEPEKFTPPIHHYAGDEGGFVLDQSVNPPLLKFDRSTEILILKSVPGPRGDIIYKLDNGAIVLRQTMIGGMTVFDAARPEGRPVVKDRADKPLVLPPSDPDQIRARARALADELSVKLNRNITFEMNWNKSPDNGLALATLGDAVERTGAALNRIADDNLGREALAMRLSRIRITQGETAQATLSENILTITYDGTKGVLGRLSSDALVAYLESIL